MRVAFALANPFAQVAPDGHTYGGAGTLVDECGSNLAEVPQAQRVSAQTATRHRLEAIKRATGARGLRAILEQAMLEVMYELPAKTEVKKCIVSKGVITQGARPAMLLADGTELTSKSVAAEKAESA